jgi:hypothetical protein
MPLPDFVCSVGYARLTNRSGVQSKYYDLDGQDLGKEDGYCLTFFKGLITGCYKKKP